MINSNELRIGNFLLFAETGAEFKVNQIDEKGLGVENESENVWIEIETFEPIPLTEKRLLDFGFSKEDYTEGYIGIDCKNAEFVLCGPNEFKGYYTFSFKLGGIPMFKKIESVHELQNLYFALTGEELKNS